jgi:hypothetical protein
MRIRIECGLDSRSRAGFWPNDRAGVRAVRTIQDGKNGVRIRFQNIRYIYIYIASAFCVLSPYARICRVCVKVLGFLGGEFVGCGFAVRRKII